jgi:peptidoglycan hydrolase-like protein with peptidoglycan-binding domain
MALSGYDVSSYQEPSKAADSEFVIAKSTEGHSWKDPEYSAHARAARGRGQLFGAYDLVWTNYDPVDCARAFIANSGLQQGELACLDFEPLTVKRKMPSWLDPKHWPDWIIAWDEEIVSQTGVHSPLYLNDWHAGQVLSYATAAQAVRIHQMPFWKAGRGNLYLPAPTGGFGDLHGWDRVTLWQWGDLRGIDHNLFYGDASDWRALGVGGSGKVDPPATPPKKEDQPVATSANGWRTFDTDPGPQFVAPTGQTPDVATKNLAVIFAYVMWRIDTEIRPLKAVYGGRTLAGQKKANPYIDPNTSNHRSYTACDQWDDRAHLYEPKQTGTYHSGYTKTEEAKIRKICADTGVLQWGGDFPSPYRDPVHIQVRQARNHGLYGPRVVSSTDVKNAAARLARWVKKVQTVVGAAPDGLAGPGTIAAVKAWQSAHGLIPDGIFGAKSQIEAGWRKPKPAPDPVPAKKSKHNFDLDEDGKFGHESVDALEVLAGVKKDGHISGQDSHWENILWGINNNAIDFVRNATTGSRTVKWLQTKVGVHPDGKIGPDTIKGIQRYLRKHGFPKTPIDGKWGHGLSLRMQRAINRGVFE